MRVHPSHESLHTRYLGNARVSAALMPANSVGLPGKFLARVCCRRLTPGKASTSWLDVSVTRLLPRNCPVSVHTPRPKCASVSIMCNLPDRLAASDDRWKSRFGAATDRYSSLLSAFGSNF